MLTITAQAVDKYIAVVQEGGKVDPRLQTIVEKMFARCFADKEYKQAIGIALESKRLDILEEAIVKSNEDDLLPYVLDVTMSLVQNLEFRNQVLILLVKLFVNLKEPDYFSMSECFVYLYDYAKAADLLKELVQKGDKTNIMTAYQIAFDMESSATQDFLHKVSKSLPASAAPASTSKASVDAMDTEETPATLSVAGTHYARIRQILSGEESIKLYLEFLFRNNNTDMLTLKNTKNALESRNSVFHTAVTFANAFLHAGTTVDDFLRSNLEWLSKATNWSKFSATAALGVIHKGHLSEGLTLLAPYLPQDGVNGSAYSEGGSLFALGLINANHGAGVLQYLRNALKSSQAEIVQHGACLGLGAAGMATGNADIYEELKTILFNDSAVAGEAAGIAMGFIMLGTANQEALDEMLRYAHDTQHEKIIRGLAIGMSLIMYGKEEMADTLIEQLCGDKDPVLRYGGIYTVALAYAGTGNNKAIRRLLHVAVSDVNDDVRRAAVTSLGFLLYKTPQQVPRIVQLLAESYNPHVRYGATLALGISCAGTGLIEAIDLLEPLTKDPVDFVRQGALISLAMILIQQNEVMNPKVSSTRKLYEKIIGDKHEDAMAKFGAVLASGIIDAGGRNVTITLQSRTGIPNMASIVGLALFTQFWFWFPLSHFLSLAFTPTAIIGLNENLDIPKLDFVSNARPSQYAYPSAAKAPTTAVVEKVATAVLSTTAKAHARAKKTEREKANAEAMDTDAPSEPPSATETKAPELKEGDAGADKMNGEAIVEASAPGEKKPTKRRKEESFEVLSNMARVLPQQLKVITFKEDSRYVPVKKGKVGGILMMLDRKPGEPEELIKPSAPSAAPAGQKIEEEADVPEPFQYPFDNETEAAR